MILPAARLWYEGKSKDLEDIIEEAKRFHLNGYARCVFKGSGQSFIIFESGKVSQVLEIGPSNRPLTRTLRDLWGKSKIKTGLLQLFEIPFEIQPYLLRIVNRQLVLQKGHALSELKKAITDHRKKTETTVMDIRTPMAKTLLIIENQSIVHCFFTENEGFTLTGLEAFKKLVSDILKNKTFQIHCSERAEKERGNTPWLPILLDGAEYESPATNLKNRLIDRYGHYYGPGTTLFREGDTSTDFFIIVSGSVAIFKEKKGRRKILAELGSDEFFGEMAIFNQAPRAATAETVENSLLIRIGQGELETLLYNSYEFRINMVKKLAHRLSDTVDEMVRLWENPRAIYMEKIIFQILNSDQKWLEEGIPPGLLMQEISNSSGMRFSEIDAVFRKFLESGKIEFIRGKVVMKEPSSLP